MRLRVLGCAGGIGGRERLTTCLAVDDDILLDAGTGISSLGLEDLARIRHVFLTHSHLDHVAGLALLTDAAMINSDRGGITVHATQPVIDILKQHLFNWALWPDFGAIPSAQRPVLRWQAIAHGDTVALDGRLITPYPVNHMEGSSAWWVRNATAGFLFTGDMCATPALWQRFAQEALLRHVIVDCSFTNADHALAKASRHFCPQTLLEDIRGLPQSPEFLIYHLKPGQEDMIMNELAADGSRTFRAVRSGDIFDY